MKPFHISNLVADARDKLDFSHADMEASQSVKLNKETFEFF